MIPSPLPRRRFQFHTPLIVCALALSLFRPEWSPAAESGGSGGRCLVFFGTYTGEKSRGIYVADFDRKAGTLSQPRIAAEIPSPSFLAIHPSGRFLYAVNEVGEFRGERAGSITAYAIDRATGSLRQINQESVRGTGPCHVIVDPQGKNALVANYGGGSVAVLPIRDDGGLKAASAFVQHTGSSVNPARQKEPHAHSINLDPAGRYAFVADLGLDKVLIYAFDTAAGTLTAANPPHVAVKPGAGPRHFDFHPSGRFAYVINELQSTVTAFRWNPIRRALEETQTLSTLPEGFQGNNSTAEVRVHPSGRFLYGSNRGHDSIAVFQIEAADGRLKWIENEATQGRTPRNFNIDPSGTWLLAANQDSDSVVVFKVDTATGALTPAGSRIELGRPVCVRFLVLDQ